MTLKLFVADDSVTIQKVIELAFKDTGTVIESVTNGESALDKIRAFHPDVVLADICMPDVNGYEICSMIKENPELSHMPVVLLVGTFEQFDEAEATRVQYDAQLTKPFDTTELVEVVQKLVGRHTMDAENVSDTTAYSWERDMLERTPAENSCGYKTRIPVSPRAMDSFLGDGRILDVFDSEYFSAKKPFMHSPAETVTAGTAQKPLASSSPVITADLLSEELLDTIVEKVVERMSTEVVSEIAWEIVPELSEILIKRSIEESRKA